MGEAKRRQAAGFRGVKPRALTRQEPRWLRDNASSPAATQAQWERQAALHATQAAAEAQRVQEARAAFLRQQDGSEGGI